MAKWAKTKQIAGGLHITVDFSSTEDVAKLFATSDVHLDSPLCRRDLFARHLEIAAAQNAPVLLAGDFFDAMQGFSDPRRSYAELDERFVGRNDYFNAITEFALDFLRPYAKSIPIFIFCRGNHETAVTKKAGIDLLSVLSYSLTNKTGAKTFVLGYEAWIIFQFVRGKKTVRRIAHIHHGFGGSAPVTKGVIHTARQAVYLPDANIVFNGHNHAGWYVPIKRKRLSQAGVPYEDLLHFIRTPGYKRPGDWEIEKMPAPNPHGGAWLEFMPTRINDRFAVKERISLDLA